MRTVTSLSELEAALKKEMRKALEVTQKKAEADMYEQTEDYYVGTNPVMYQRTGALGDTPRTSAVKTSGKKMSFDAYLDTSHQYTTGDNPTMEQVLQLANYGSPWITSGGREAHAAIGKKGFWERAKEKMESDASNTFGQFFNK